MAPLQAQVVSSITSGFNGTSIADTSTVWFNSHITGVSGGTPPTNLYFLGQKITIATQSNGTLIYNIPDSQIIITGNSSTTPSTIFDSGTNRWVTTVPNDSGNPFLGGFTLDVPTGIELKASDVTWAGTFYTDAADLPLSGAWQWSAAVYTNFSTNYNALGVTPVDGMGASQSGTPLNFTNFVTGGARGGGGSNFTGSNSGTGSFSAVAVPEPSGMLLGMAALLTGVLTRRRKAA